MIMNNKETEKSHNMRKVTGWIERKTDKHLETKEVDSHASTMGTGTNEETSKLSN